MLPHTLNKKRVPIGQSSPSTKQEVGEIHISDRFLDPHFPPPKTKIDIAFFIFDSNANG